ncbi:hypothetical protein [Candidatus Accumulibacter sp. ACC007]|uniref:hypothetical protein n=1 Tax=Candidatus Accumulibacter sp. ACC007 TaxID=2823333 RepID=UPI0025B8F6A0|nr:hypothetical protein [Candidatus Accumulibacter sp. ACC007]
MHDIIGQRAEKRAAGAPVVGQTETHRQQEPRKGKAVRRERIELLLDSGSSKMGHVHRRTDVTTFGNWRQSVTGDHGE